MTISSPPASSSPVSQWLGIHNPTQSGSSWRLNEPAKFTSCYGPADLLALHRSGLLRSSFHSLCYRREQSKCVPKNWCYQLIEQKRRGTVNGPFDLAFISETPGEKKELILRRKAAATRFLTVLEPVKVTDAVRAVRVEKGSVVIESAKGTRRTPPS